MSLAKIASGDGYEYYMRSVATHDANDRGALGLSAYYSERGESPGRWWGSGLASVGIEAGEQVSEAQMRALIGHGLHPNAFAIIRKTKAEQLRLGAKLKDAKRFAEQQAKLGRPYGNYIPSEISYRQQCAEAYADWNTERGRVGYAPIPEEDRSRIRSEVAGRMFAEEYGRDPRDDRELSGWVARASRPSTKAVAGYDLTFSPVKSVSALWALAPREVSGQIEAAHHAAIVDALEYLEAHAVYTRVGRHSVRQVDVEGLLATMFDHRDSRAGDPDLHTHVVISNKVRRLDGQWGALDGRMIYRHNVSASEIYNSRLEHHLETSLGLVFAEIAPTGKRPIREIVGANHDLLGVWSKRSAAIEAKLTDLARQFQDNHHREPTPAELLDLGQEATLRTRTGKPAARTHAEQRQDWRRDAVEVLGGTDAVNSMVAAMLGQQLPQREAVTDVWVSATAARVIDTVAETRATWQAHHVRAETERQLRGAIDPTGWRALVERVAETALSQPYSVPRGVQEQVPTAEALTRRDGTSVYTTAEALLHTSPQILAAEQRLVDASLRADGHVIPVEAVDLAVVEYAANNDGRTFNQGQQALAREFAVSGARLQVVIAPAGTGKTTAMQALTRAWTAEGGNVLAMSPLGAQAARLGREIGVPGVTVDVLVTLADALAAGDLDLDRAPEWLRGIDNRTLVILDEVAKTPTVKLDAAVSWLLDRGASVRAVGDDRQLASVAAGGVVRDIISAAGASTLTTVMRMTDPAERAASLALREGDPAAIAHYTDNARVHVGTLGVVAEQAFQAWDADRRAGLDTALLAPTRELVASLNLRARTARLQREGLQGSQVALSDGLSASAGDIVVTRLNNYRLRISSTDHVRNGYRWLVHDVHADGRITATHLESGRRVTMPADYVRAHVELGYAATIDSSQGLTVDTCHGVLTGRESRAQLYVLATRARTGNHLYLATAGTGAEAAAYTYTAVHAPTAVDMLTEILGRDGTQTSATTQARDATDPRRQLAGVIDAYLDALGVAADARLGGKRLVAITATAEQLVPGITSEEAWPVLRQHLSMIALSGRDPITELTAAVAARELDTADDKAAVLHWRIGHAGTGPGPLGWVPEVPAVLRTDLDYGEHLRARATQVRDLAAHVDAAARAWTAETAPVWAQAVAAHAPNLTAALAIWRAAHAIPDHDRRPTGHIQYPVDERRVQVNLDAAVRARLGDLDADTRRWKPLAREVDARIVTDPYWPQLAGELSRAAAAGVNVPAAVHAVAGRRPLPDEQPAAALRWRMTEILDAERDLTFDDVRAQLAHGGELQQMTDTALVARKATLNGRLRHTPQVSAGQWVGSSSVTQAQAELDKLLHRQQQLRDQAAAIRIAMDAEEHLAQVEAAHTAATKKLARAERALKETKWWEWQTRTARQAAIDTARAEFEPLPEQLADAKAAASTTARATNLARQAWNLTLTQADNTAARASEIDMARDRLASAHEHQQRQRQRHEDIQARIQAVGDEQQRRVDLPTERRDLEDRARDENAQAELTDTITVRDNAAATTRPSRTRPRRRTPTNPPPNPGWAPARVENERNDPFDFGIDNDYDVTTTTQQQHTPEPEQENWEQPYHQLPYEAPSHDHGYGL
ncbi:MobF family relaxase [Nocardia vinacea]|uniref:MobF family relaxase n=1 Tax=Nocardia vinacea TaxID=96468 RepID=UPI00344A9C84